MLKGYEGQFETIGLFGTMPCGNSHIITQYAEVARGNVDEEAKILVKQMPKDLFSEGENLPF